MPTGQNLIYGLVDPRTRFVRYVGLSTTGMVRPREHRKTRELKKTSYKSSWIKSLIALGIDYEVVVLEETTRGALGAAECFWIAYGRACGWPLTNLASGGPGNIGWKASPETRARMSASGRGRVFSPEHRAKLSTWQKGKKLGPERLALLQRARDAKRPSDQLSAETRAKLSAAANKRWQKRIA